MEPKLVSFVLVTGKLKPSQHHQGRYWWLTFKGKKTYIQGQEVRFFAENIKEGEKSIDKSQLTYLKIEQDLTDYKYDDYEQL